MTSLLFAFYLVSPSRFNYAKFHSLNHLVGLVERFGPPMQYNMQPFEGMHRPLIKVGVRMTNFRGHIALAVMKRVSSGWRSGRWRLVVGQVAACQLCCSPSQVLRLSVTTSSLLGCSTSVWNSCGCTCPLSSANLRWRCRSR
jgi:hypothetical protein